MHIRRERRIVNNRPLSPDGERDAEKDQEPKTWEGRWKRGSTKRRTRNGQPNGCCDTTPTSESNRALSTARLSDPHQKPDTKMWIMTRNSEARRCSSQRGNLIHSFVYSTLYSRSAICCEHTLGLSKNMFFFFFLVTGKRLTFYN